MKNKQQGMTQSLVLQNLSLPSFCTLLPNIRVYI